MEVFIYLFSFFIYIILNTSTSIGLILVREVYHVFLPTRDAQNCIRQCGRTNRFSQ